MKQASKRELPAAALFAGFVLTWFVYGVVVDHGKSLDGDVVEAYIWGRAFRLGYNQHPPLWAWISGLWFLIFPVSDWAFHLLAVLNAAIGLVGSWRLIGEYETGWSRPAALNLLLLTPFYTFLSYKYNANSVFLSIWPWTLYFFVTSLATRRPRSAIGLGLMFGAAFLSKYYAVTLALSCLVASLMHPARRLYYRSAAPYVSIGICALLVLPHIVWLLVSDAPPVAYIWARTGRGLIPAIFYAGQLIGAIVLYHIAVVLVVLVAAFPVIHLDLRSLRRDPGLLVLCFGPVILTILFGLVFELKISSNMMIGTFPLVSVVIIKAFASADRKRLYVFSKWSALGLAVVALVASPLIAYLAVRGRDPAATEPRQELADFVTGLWRERIGTKLPIVAGSDPYENAIGFYSPDRPEVFIDFSHARAPWVTDAALERDGLLIACVQADSMCHALAAPFETARTRQESVSLARKVWGKRHDPVVFDLFLIPPAHAFEPPGPRLLQ